MKARIVALLAALGLALVALASPASASTTQKSCSNDGAVCLSITYSKDSGSQGFYVYSLRMHCDWDHYGVRPIAGWDDIAVDGHGLDIYNIDNLSLQFHLTDANSNLHLDSGGTNVCTRDIDVNEHYPNMHHLYIYWQFTEQLNNQHDFDDAIAMNIINA